MSIHSHDARANGRANGKSHGWIDIPRVAEDALHQAKRLVLAWLPNGRLEGREWVALNPTRADTKPGSFKINLATGEWADFATGDSGLDLVSLKAYLDGLSQLEAAFLVETEIGRRHAETPRKASRSAATTSAKVAPAAGEKGGAVIPAPREATTEELRHSKRGLPSSVWPYYAADGALHHMKARYDQPDGGKAFCYWHWTGTVWDYGAPAAPFPLYNIADVIERVEAPVLIVEGEKAADAAATLFPGYAVVTSGGDNSASDADWTGLAGRRVVIWPDHDKPGMRYADSVATLAAETGAESVAVVAVPDAWPEKWDLADVPSEGVTTNDLIAMLDAAKPWRPDARLPAPIEPGEWPVPDMSLIEGARRVRPKPCLGAVGGLASWVESTARGKASPVDFVMLGLLVTCSSLIGAKRWIVATNKWREPAMLWGANVANSSDGKSPAMETLEDAVKEAERPLMAAYNEKLSDYETAVEIARAKSAHWKKQVEQAVKDGAMEPSRPDGASEPERPLPPTIWLSDVTREHVATVMAGNPGGILAYRDELAGFIGSFDSYGGNGADRAFWLETIRGRAYRVGRKTSGQVDIPFCAASILGSIQPEKLNTLMLGGDNDGFAARFLYVWPDPEEPIDLEDTEDDDDKVRAVVSRLATLKMGSNAGGAPMPSYVKLTPEAREAFSAWRKGHVKAARRVPGVFGSWLGKCPGFVLRTALILEYLWWAQTAFEVSEPGNVSARAIGFALALMDEWFVPHARRVFRESAVAKVDIGAAELARWLVERPEDQCAGFNASRARRTARLHGIREAKEMDAACAELVEAGWIRGAGMRAGGLAGRQSKDFAINPAIYRGGGWGPAISTISAISQKKR